MNDKAIRVEREDAVAWLTLSRPRAGNGVNEELAQELLDACRAVRQDDTVRVLVVTGKGTAFCAGRFPPEGLLAGNPGPREMLERMRRLRVAASVAAVEKPVVAAINGPAIGPGLELALACDIRLAAPEASFSLPHLQHGLLPWDGGTQRLGRTIGLSRATEMLLTGRRLTARRAEAIGLVHQVAPLGQLAEVANALAQRIASGAPIAARYAKEAVLRGTNLPLEDALRLEADFAVLLQSTDDRAEGIASFLQRRSPRFLGR